MPSALAFGTVLSKLSDVRTNGRLHTTWSSRSVNWAGMSVYDIQPGGGQDTGPYLHREGVVLSAHTDWTARFVSVVIFLYDLADVRNRGLKMAVKTKRMTERGGTRVVKEPCIVLCSERDVDTGIRHVVSGFGRHLGRHFVVNQEDVVVDAQYRSDGEDENSWALTRDNFVEDNPPPVGREIDVAANSEPHAEFWLDEDEEAPATGEDDVERGDDDSGKRRA